MPLRNVMKDLFRYATALCLFTVMFCTASLLHAEGNTSRIKASAIKVEMIRSDEIHLPDEFQVPLYDCARCLFSTDARQAYRRGHEKRLISFP